MSYPIKNKTCIIHQSPSKRVVKQNLTAVSQAAIVKENWFSHLANRRTLTRDRAYIVLPA